MGIEKKESSGNKTHKFLRNAAILASLLTVMNTTQSCKNKNTGMPITVNGVELTAEEKTATSWESIDIDNNKVSFCNSFDAGPNNPSWMNKSINYSVEVSKDNNGGVTVFIYGNKMNGNDGDLQSFEKKFNYTSLESFYRNMVNDVKNEIDSIVIDLQSNDDQYVLTPEGKRTEEAEKRFVKNTSEISHKTQIVLNWLKYYNTVQNNPVQKNENIVSIPFSRKGKKIDLQLQKAQVESVVINKQGENEFAYDLNINGNPVLVYLNNNPIQSAERLFDKIPESMRKNISEQEKYEKFLPKLLEAVQSLKQ